MKLGELFIALGFKGGPEFLQVLDKAKIKTIAFANDLSKAVKSLDDMSAAAREHAYAMDLYEKTTGKSADELQNLSYQAAQFNVTQEELAETLRNIQQITTDVRLGRGMPSAFPLLGIDPNQDPAQILAELQKAIKTLDAPTALNIASELGINEKMFYMLKMSTKGMEQLNKQYRITAQERSDLIKLNAEWQKFWFLLRQILTKFQASTAELQAKSIKRFLEIANRIAEMASAFLKAMEASTALRIAVVALGIALTAAFAPWLVLLSAVFLVLEDIWTYFEGGDSITGRIAEWIEKNKILETGLINIKKIIDACVKAYEMLVKGAQKVGEYFGSKSVDSNALALEEQNKNRQWLFENDREAYMRQYGGSSNKNVSNTINNTFYSNEAPSRDDIAGASSDAIYQLGEVM